MLQGDFVSKQMPREDDYLFVTVNNGTVKNTMLAKEYNFPSNVSPLRAWDIRNGKNKIVRGATRYTFRLDLKEYDAALSNHNKAIKDNKIKLSNEIYNKHGLIHITKEMYDIIFERIWSASFQYSIEDKINMYREESNYIQKILLLKEWKIILYRYKYSEEDNNKWFYIISLLCLHGFL